MAEQVIEDLKAEVEKIAKEHDQEQFRILRGNIRDISDMLAVNILQNNMLLGGMDQLIVQRLGTSFLQKKENKELLKQINRILERINERNGVTQRRLEQWIAVFQERLQREMERTESD